tara:strand:- start:51 stop:230 length:180 start_codon:yes stop_codon:yes gene_type:complete
MVLFIAFIVAGKPAKVLTKVIAFLVFVSLPNVIFALLARKNVIITKEPAGNPLGGRKIV